MANRFSTGGNPFLQNGFKSESDSSITMTTEGTMTIQGAINKAFILFGLLLLTSVWSFQSPNMIFLIGGAILGLVIVLINAFKREWSPYLAPAYAIVEGFVVGTVSAFYGSMYGGIVIQAISLTILVLFIMLVIQKTGWVPVTDKFRTGVIMATGGIALLYLVTMILGFFHINIPYIHQSGPIGILFSLGVIGVASLNLLLDFDNIIKGEQYRAPKYMEWFSAMGLLITLVWLYFEMLRLLGKLKN